MSNPAPKFRKEGNRPFLVGIAGGSGSGKTYLSQQLLHALGAGTATVLSMDQYFTNPAKGTDVRDVNFDHPAHLDFELMLTHLRALRGGEVIERPTYDFVRMRRRKESVSVRPTRIIIVEGLFVLAKPMVEVLDATCFLDVSDDQRLLGRILRDVPQRGATMDEVVDRYQRFVRPSYQIFVAPTKQNADIVVDFTYRRILFTKLLTLLLREYADGRAELHGLVKEMRTECYHLGFTPSGQEMPMSVDILELAKAYPEHLSAKPNMQKGVQA